MSYADRIKIFDLGVSIKQDCEFSSVRAIIHLSDFFSYCSAFSSNSSNVRHPDAVRELPP